MEAVRVEENLKRKPGGAPAANQPERVFEGYILDVEFSKAQTVYVVLFTPGLMLFGFYILSMLSKPMPNSDVWIKVVIGAVGAVFVLLGIAFPFLMKLGRRKVAKAFSAQGVKIWNGKILPWTEVNAIVSGDQNINENSFRKLDISFRDGSSVYVSAYWAVNFDEIEEYLSRMPQYSS